MSDRAWLRGVVLAALVLPGPATAVAQAVHGTLVEEETGTPIPGAFVTLTDDEGTERAGRLTDDEGRFLLEAPTPGRYLLRAERIGFESTVAGPLRLRTGERLEYRLRAPARAVELPGLSVAAEPRCGRLAGSGAAAALWAEARKALRVASWASREGVHEFELVRYRRTLHPQTERVLREARRSFGVTGEIPIRSRPARILADSGWVRALDDGGTQYYGPDAETLLSDPFLETHCFHVRPPDGDTAWIGLAFEPLPDRELPDIRGVLWLDRATAELRRLEYGYTALPREVDAFRFGGSIEFDRLPTGAWIVGRWSIRIPALGRRQVRIGSSMQERTVLASILEEGGHVVRASSAGGEMPRLEEAPDSGGPLASPCPPRPAGRAVVGRVRQRSGAPAVGARVLLTWRGDDGDPVSAETRADADGRYHVCGVAADRALAAVAFLGWSTGPAAAIQAGGSLTRLDLVLPDDGAPGRPGGGGVVGFVRDEAEGRAVTAALVAALTAGGDTIATATTDSLGRYRLGPLQPGGYTVRAARLGHAAAEATVRVGDGPREVDFLLPTRPVAVTPVVVAAGARDPRLADAGFYARRAAGVGLFIDREEIDERHPRQLSDLMYGRVGLRVVHPSGSSRLPHADVRFRGTERINGLDCQPRILLDGVLARPGGTPRPGDLVLDQVISPEQVAGLEIYRAGTEPTGEVAGTGTGCGVILLWSRR